MDTRTLLATTQLEDESTTAYLAWRAYAEMGADRSQEAVAQKLSKSRQLMARWSVQYDWQKRLITWEHEEAERQNDAKKQAALESARAMERRKEILREREWDVAERLFKKAEVMINWPLQKQERKGENGEIIEIAPLQNWRWLDGARAMEIADSLARLATDMPQRHTAVTGKDGESLVQGAVPATVIVNVTRDDNDPVRALFGDRPADRA